MTRRAQIQFLILRTVGNFLVLFGLFGAAATFGPAIFEETRFQIDTARGIHYVLPQQSQLGGFIATANNQKILTAPDPFFSIIIPKIGAAERVIPNVDSTNQAEYVKALEKGIAHAKGTVFPGLSGTTFLFAHSTDSFFNVGRYNAVFYLLKDLQVGDDIVLFFKNARYNYKVTETKIIDPSEVTLLTKAQESEEQLVLQTCWPPGTTWKRQIVIAKPVGK